MLSASIYKQGARFLRARLRSVVLIILVSLILGGLIAWELHTTYVDAANAVRLSAQNLSLLLKAQLDGAFGETDLVLRDLADKIAPDTLNHLAQLDMAEKHKLVNLLADKQATLPQVDSLALISGDGALAITGETVGPTRADQRSYFKQLIDNPGQAVVISPPLPGRTTRDLGFVITRRIPGANGKPAGAIAATVSLEYFNQLARRMETAGNDSQSSVFTLVDSKLRIVGRYPEVPELIGQPAPDPEFLAGWVNGRSSGYAAFVSPVDGVRRGYNFYRLDDFPFITIVGVSESNYLANWRLKAIAYIVSGGLLSLFMLAMAWRGWREAQLNLAIRLGEQRLQEQSQHVERMLQMIGWPILMIRASDLQILVANTAANELCAREGDGLPGRSLTTLLLDPTREEEMARLMGAHNTIEELEVQLSLPNGGTPWVALSATPIEFHGIEAFFVSLTDISERKEAQAVLLHKATTDPLTGIANRGYFIERAQMEWLRASRYGHRLGVLLIDLDHFKAINDNHGHDAGDLVLRVITARLQQETRETDLFGRLGGEEFAIVVPEERAEDDLMRIAERMRDVVAANAVPLPDGKSLRVTISVGCILSDSETPDFDLLLRQADRALYAAKRGGRNRVEYYRPSEEMS